MRSGLHLLEVERIEAQYGAVLKLRCLAGKPRCGRLDDDPAEKCNAVEWWNEVDGVDLLDGVLEGPGPWLVDVTWSLDGPELRAHE